VRRPLSQAGTCISSGSPSVGPDGKPRLSRGARLIEVTGSTLTSRDEVGKAEGRSGSSHHKRLKSHHIAVPGSFP
jgi:hypothetical protein